MRRAREPLLSAAKWKTFVRSEYLAFGWVPVRAGKTRQTYSNEAVECLSLALDVVARERIDARQ
jgi:hypothetical protein